MKQIDELQASLRFAQSADIDDAFKQLFRDADEAITEIQARRDSLLDLAGWGSEAMKSASARIEELERELEDAENLIIEMSDLLE